MEQRVDMYSGVKFIPTRVNQKFANAKNRISYHNKRAQKIRLTKSAYDKPLHKNYLILSELLSNAKSGTFHKEFLLGKGFSFQLYTHVTELDGKRYYALYSFVIIQQDNDYFKILRHD